MPKIARRAAIAVVPLTLCSVPKHDAVAQDLKVPGWVFFRTSPLKPDESRDRFAPFVIAKVQVDRSARKFIKNGHNDYAEIDIVVKEVFGDSDVQKGKYMASVSLAQNSYKKQPPDDDVSYEGYWYCLLKRESDGSLRLLQRDLRVVNGRF